MAGCDALAAHAGVGIAHVEKGTLQRPVQCLDLLQVAVGYIEFTRAIVSGARCRRAVSDGEMSSVCVCLPVDRESSAGMWGGGSRARLH